MIHEELVQREKIKTTVIRLFNATDEKDWETVKSCFGPEVHFDVTSMSGGYPATLNPEQIAGAWEEGLDGIEHVHHQAGNFIIDIDEHEARVFCYAIAYHYKDLPSGNNTRTYVGSYNFGLSMIDKDHWVIDAFKYNLKFIDGNLDLE
jgi:hypothetical protein